MPSTIFLTWLLYYFGSLHLDPYIINYNLPPTIIHWLNDYSGSLCSPRLYSLGLTNAHLPVLLMSNYGWLLYFGGENKVFGCICGPSERLQYPCTDTFHAFSPHVVKHCYLLKYFSQSLHVFLVIEILYQGL